MCIRDRGLGDAALIAAAHRPIRGARDDYRATLRHAVSRVRGGERHGLELPLDGHKSCLLYTSRCV